MQVVVASSDHCGVQGAEAELQSNIVDTDIESPSDVASVSKFIKEFHVRSLL